jgi:hypothetical protein
MKPSHSLPRTGLLFFMFLVATIFADTAFGQTVRGQITGRVVTTDGTPIVGVAVAARRVENGDAPPTPVGAATTDAAGTFTLSGLAPQLYRIDITAPGFAAPEVATRARIGESVTIRMTRGGAITGRVTDQASRPLVEAQVRTLRVADTEGKPVLTGNRPLDFTLTDDRGQYRRWGLTPGHYIVWVEGTTDLPGPPSPIDGDAPTFYPNTTRAGAREVIVTEGGDATDIDIRHRGQTGVAVTGNITGFPAQSSTRVKLLDAATQTVVLETIQFNRPDFRFTGVPPGDYDLVAGAILPKRDRAYSEPIRVTVKTKDVEGLTVPLIVAGTITGKIGATAPDKERLDLCKVEPLSPIEETQVEALPKKAKLAGEMPVTAGDEAGAFRLPGVHPGDTVISITPPAAWYVASLTEPATPNPKPLGQFALKKGASLDGVTVTLEFGAAQLRGTVASLPKSPEAVQKLRVHLVPLDEAQVENPARYYETTVAPGGGFEFKNLAPGRYAVVVLKKDVPEGDNPAFPVAADPVKRKMLLETAKSAKTVELAPCRTVEDFKIEVTP